MAHIRLKNPKDVNNFLRFITLTQAIRWGFPDADASMPHGTHDHFIDREVHVMRGLITGIVRQDRSRLTGMLPHTGLDAYGILGRTSLLNTRRVGYIYWRRHDPVPCSRLQCGNLTHGTAASRRLPNPPSRPQHQSSPR
jgi:hypothetical protein